MGKGPNKERGFEFVLRERGVSEKDIGWVLSKLDSQEYILYKCYYMQRMPSKELKLKFRGFLLTIILL